MNSNRIQLLAPLTPAECASRLSVAIDAERLTMFSVAGWSGSRPVVGRVTNSSLRLRKRLKYRNSFQSFLTATMRPEAGGTLISGEVAMHPFIRVFMVVWLGNVGLIGVLMLLVTISSMMMGSDHADQDAWMGSVIPAVMFTFGFGLVGFGRYLARDEGRFLTNFLMQTLDIHTQM